VLFVLSAPSGAGKTTIARAVLRCFPALRFSVSATTRPKRPVETHGKDYFFLTRGEFEARIAAGGLVEWEEIFGNLYGTLTSEVDAALAAGEHLLFDVDVKGALSIKRIYGDAALIIFIRPPDLGILRARLERRGTDTPEVIDRRLERAAWEIDQAPAFDRTVINDDLTRSVPEVEDIIRAHIARLTTTAIHS
jgi:guanylate kinase